MSEKGRTNLDHLISIFGVFQNSGAGSDGLVSKMRRNQSILVLDLERRLEEAVHEFQGLLLIIEHSAAINALKIDVEESLSLAAFDELLDLGWFLREQLREINGLHGINGDLLSVPCHRLGEFGCDTHDV